ncbi:amidase [Nocardioides jishulii]|uniref:Amidase n=1 Tax=Nocardioides jishulii TaxID=2575440 RepID=A0A4U2YWD0_9ACTN|nr:amidase [Nocardioides jishulii]QCX28636.1 amidase [Nocardioides jishulii]TKI64471.1 amidase [Nocardioides jishulii]
MEPIHAFTDDALGTDDAVGLVTRLQRGEVSSSELVEASIARIESVDGALGAVAVRDYGRARVRASGGRRGWFAGLPMVLKDNVDVRGLPTQEGTDAFVAPPSPVNGDVARLFHRLGTVSVAKTRLSEFGFSGACDHPRQGPVRNPWRRDHYAGASSSGAGALVATGAVPLAHGNDGGGSIRIPAAVNGLVGLKPTRGRVPSDAFTRQMPVRIVADGVLTRSVRDTAAFLREAEKVYRDPRLPAVGDVTRPVDRPLRIAVVTAGIGREATPEVRQLTLDTAARLEALGHHVEEVDPPVPDWFADSFLLYWSMLAMYLVRTGPRAHRGSWDPTKLDNLTLGLARHCRRNIARLPAAIAAMGASQQSSRRHFAAYDVTLTPTLATETPKVGHLDPTRPYEEVIDRLMDWVAFTPLQNATGDPAVSLPLARTASGLPQGMQLCGGWGSEALLLGLALQLEEAHPWPRIGA